MSGSHRFARGRFSTRRKILLALVLALLGIVAYLHFTGAAGTHGLEGKDMDWNGDGQVSQIEMLQSFYAVVVTKQRQEPRECSTYAWRGTGEVIRVDCRTSFEPAPAKAE